MQLSQKKCTEWCMLSNYLGADILRQQIRYPISLEYYVILKAVMKLLSLKYDLV